MSDKSPAYRMELKYWITHETRRKLLQRWSRLLVRDPHTDEHAQTPILSLYYDSPNLELYREKVEGLAERKKVRLRSYANRFNYSDKLFWEIKIKKNDYIKKLRFPLVHTSKADFDLSRVQYPNPYLEKKFTYLNDLYQLVPTAQIFYIREAYVGLVESDVRVTMDSNLIALRPEESLRWQSYHESSNKIIPDDRLILEIKTTKSFPAWIYDSISDFGLQLKSISKYVLGVDKLNIAQTHSNSGVFIT